MISPNDIPQLPTTLSWRRGDDEYAWGPEVGEGNSLFFGSGYSLKIRLIQKMSTLVGTELFGC